MLRRLCALTLGISATALAAAPASAAPSLLAPPKVCPGQTSTTAKPAAKAATMRCLITYARKRQGVRPLRANAWLNRSATTKVRRVSSCGQFSHSPCGIRMTLSKTPFHRFGEVIYAGLTPADATPRATMSAWLRSKAHRTSLLNRNYRFVGIGVAPGRVRGERAWIWAANLAS